MGWLDDVGNAVEHALHTVNEEAGHLVDDGAHAAASVARAVGADGVASDLENLGDQVVDATGGQVRERELGESDDPKQLVLGDPGKITHVGGEVKKMGDSIEKTGDALKKIDVAAWTGASADAFHEEFGKQPKLWWQGADAMHAAAGVLDTWYHEVSAAQSKAADAVAKWKQADTEERTKKNAWNALSDEQKRKTPLVDTWSAMRSAAQEILRGARTQRDNAATTAAAGLAKATETAPPMPSFTEQMKDDFTDATQAWDQAKGHFTKGLVTSFTGIVQFVRQVSPLDSYNITHPAEYVKGMSDLGTGMVVALADPGAVASSLLHDVRKDPSEFVGSLTGDLVTTIGTGGAGAAKPALSAVKEVSEVSRATKAVHAAEDVAEHAPHSVPKVDAPHVPEAPKVSTPHETAPAPTDAASPHTPENTAPAQHSSPPGTDHTPASADTASAQHTDSPIHSTNPETQTNAPGSHTDSPGPQSDTSAHADHSEPQPDTSPHTDSAPSHPDSAQPAKHTGPEQPAAQQHPTTDNAATAQHPDAQAAHPDTSASPHETPATEHTPADSGTHSDSGPHADSSTTHQDSSHPDTSHQGTDHSSDHIHTDHDQRTPDQHANHTPADRAEADHGSHHEASDSGAEHDRTEHQKTTSDDPVDIATGEFLLPETDIDLPGVLALVLRRTHRSNYRRGRWFGPSWSATLDMRLVAEHEGVTFLGEDGLMLAYPHGEVGAAVEPVTGGQRWSLTRTETGTYQIWDQQRELIWHFAPEPVLGGIESRLGNYAISAITDRHRNRIRFEYDTDGVPVAVNHSGGYQVLIDTGAGRVTGLSVVDRGTAVPVRQFGYTAGELTSVINGVGATMRYAYDDLRMVLWTDSNGNQMVNTYDEAGRVIYQRGTNGILDTDFDYFEFPDGTGSLTTVTDSYGAITRHGFDNDLQLRDLIDPAGGHTHIDYNTDRRPLTVTSPDGGVTRYQYTDDGDVAKVVRPDGNSTSIEYLFRNRPTVITDPDGATRRQEWNKDGDLVAVIDAAGARTEYGRHPNGAVAETVSQGGAGTRIQVDAAGLTLHATDARGAVTRVDRDGFGRATCVTDPLGAQTLYEWSSTGKLLRRTDPDGHSESWTYDGEGNQLTHTNRAGGVTRLAYGAFDLLAVRTDPDGSATHYLWDAQRRLIGVVNPLGQRWSYEYDPAGRLSVETDYTGAATRYTHDNAGRIASVTAATGVARRNQRDILGRLTETVADTGEFIRYTHDRAGRVLAAVSGTGDEVTHTLTFNYTTTGRIHSQQLDGGPVMHYEYDQQSRRTRRTTPSGAVTAWHYDHSGRVHSLQAGGQQITWSYDALGRSNGWRVGEIAVTKTLSCIGRVTEQTVTAFPATSLSLDLGSGSRPGPSQIRHDEYDYRSDGYIANHAYKRLGAQPISRHFQIDPVGRVIDISHNGASEETYSYDALGNILTARSRGAGSVAQAGLDDLISEDQREYHNNLLIRSGNTRYHYDESGRLIRKSVTHKSGRLDTWYYRYDAFDRLVDAWTPERKWWHYTYDAFGRRTTKRNLATDGTPLQTATYIWEDSQLVEQSIGNEVRQWQYQPNSHTPILELSKNDSSAQLSNAIITDPVGMPTELVLPSDGISTAVAVSSLWGLVSWTGDTSTSLRFPGQHFDAETGLHYNLHRMYDPESGRFLTPDPLGLLPAPNPSAYTVNPTRWSDPLGLIPDDCFPIYRTPKEVDREFELANGPNPDAHAAGNRLVYFGEHSVASEYQGMGSYADGMIRYDMNPSFLEKFPDAPKRYDWKGPDGSPRIEFEIPADRIEEFNELTRNRTWIPWEGW
ncbi:putative T7SS-secreted protein [Nocardia jiangxiensis]|uniref:T7SS-secreted protein n=1 Tax=Nocardia jiangxiensis TaxID=282685 RepID=A0ABW6RVD2_9NOCA